MSSDRCDVWLLQVKDFDRRLPYEQEPFAAAAGIEAAVPGRWDHALLPSCKCAASAAACEMLSKAGTVVLPTHYVLVSASCVLPLSSALPW